MPVRVLAGTITHDGQRYCRRRHLAALAGLTYRHLDVLAVTNSGETDRDDWLSAADPLRRQGRAVTAVTNAPAGDKLACILSNRRVLRERFLAGDWEWLFGVDSDILSPPPTVEWLLGHGEDMVTGVCLGGFPGPGPEAVVRPVLYAFDQPGFVRQMSIAEVVPDRFLPLATAGLGCFLLHRRVLENLDFRLPSPLGGEDTAFFLDARKEGFTLWCDTRVKCRHQKYPDGDPRNDLLDMSLYRLKIPPEAAPGETAAPPG